ncbi:MAG: hypothetical protein DMG65_19720 [Candidatus Angelobacter sp. Gp1-AA117]|nr:MAG: hypothetical protein DMG65_19720 [Candidatus Angelobacter sp. Gp1-AA117]
MKKGMIALVLIATLVGCSKELTRGKAKDLIREKYHYDEAINYEIHSLTQVENDEWIKRGLWNRGITEYGKKFFVLDPACSCFLTVPKVRPAIEITGITGDESLKIVKYNLLWFEELPREVRDIFKDHPPDQRSCYIRLYDDGWRVEN